MRISFSWKFIISTNETVSPSTFPSFNSTVRFCSPASELAVPVNCVPSCFNVNTYFCRPICESNSVFHVPVMSAAKRANGNKMSDRTKSDVFILNNV